MWKEIVGHKAIAEKKHDDDDWMALEKISRAQLTSEDPGFPLENALSLHAVGHEKGWKAHEAGPQTITLTFLQPVKLRRIFLRFVEREHARMQEFSLRYVTQAGMQQEMVRQQWNFSTGGSTEEVEDYTVELDGVTRLELRIEPDVGRDKVMATLDAWRVA
ncbi:MAG: hypothetical protein ACP5M4_04945 [Acidobacteriaceae bacterium]